MDGALTRGQPMALAAIERMVRSGSAPHALLLAGPSSVGKTTLALDLAAGLLCTAVDPADRPCRTCRACRLVANGNHPDLHRIAPEGAGGQIGIERVRSLAPTLALMPVEGGARVAIISAAHRLNEDAQNALLKTLEEPPPGVVIVLCADEEDRLLPTVRSRCARLRLGTVAIRTIEGLLVDRGVADPPTAARLARLARGRPGLALAYATAPGAVSARAEVVRSLLDLVSQRRSARLRDARLLLDRAAEAIDELRNTTGDGAPVAAAATNGRRRGGRGRGAEIAGPSEPTGASSGSTAEPDGTAGSARVATAADRRRAAAWLIDAWRDLAMDLAIVSLGGRVGLREPELLEELETTAARIETRSITAFLGRLAEADRQLDVNVSPQLEIDVLALRWPRATHAA